MAVQALRQGRVRVSWAQGDGGDTRHDPPEWLLQVFLCNFWWTKKAILNNGITLRVNLVFILGMSPSEGRKKCFISWTMTAMGISQRFVTTLHHYMHLWEMSFKFFSILLQLCFEMNSCDSGWVCDGLHAGWSSGEETFIKQRQQKTWLVQKQHLSSS